MGRMKWSHGMVALTRLAWFIEPNRIGIITSVKDCDQGRNSGFEEEGGGAEELKVGLFAEIIMELISVKGEVVWQVCWSNGLCIVPKPWLEGRWAVAWFNFFFPSRYSLWRLVQINWALCWVQRTVLHAWHQQRIDRVMIFFSGLTVCYLCTPLLYKICLRIIVIL